MMVIVSDSSPLIMLSKIKALELLKKLYGDILMPEEVYNEIVSGEPYKDEIIYFKSFKFKVVKVKKTLEFGLGKGEESAINLALEKKAILIADDYVARQIAKNLGLKVIGTLSLLLIFLKKRLINYEKFKNLLNELIENNFRISIELYNEVLNEAEKLK